jgi:tetratricopeptide (TPR) repeat protein
MKILPSVTVAALTLSLAATAYASFGGKKDDSPSTTSSSSSNSTPEEKDAATVRQQAEQWYGDAYEDVQKAGKDLAAGKTGNAEKKFRRALERGQRATEIDTTYYQAWNLVGYASRKLKDYDRALASYERCLRLKSDYAPAREYLGEAYLELGRIDDARQQLAALEKLDSEEDTRTLSTAIADWEKAHPSTASAEGGK